MIKDYYNNKIVHGIDPYLALYNNFNNYMYNIPLCYQLFTETDNSNNWSKDIYNNSNIILYNLTIIAKKIFKILNLDVKFEPGYSFFYNTSLILFYLSIVIIFIIIYKIIYKIIYMKIK